MKVLWKQISLICFRVYLEVCVYKNPTCFSRWSVSVVKLVQIITLKGYFDINDIIIGSFGSYLAYYITIILTKIIPKQSKSII